MIKVKLTTKVDSDVLVVGLGSTNKKLQIESGAAQVEDRINKIAGVAQMEAIIQELDKATYYIERNANPKMLFMALGIKFYHIIQNKTLILTEA
jgi:hypothetical protein